MINIFVYGTLIFPEVVFALTKKSFRTEDAILNDFSRFKIYDGEISRRYPAIFEDQNGKVEGKILFDVDEESLRILDFFEDNDYQRRELKALVNSEEFTVFVYVWNPKFKDKLKSKWNPEEFKVKHLQNYISEAIPKVLQKYGR
jgi:gamma-glutamylcyclotransferase (GGCT)/AIG2-like uncharacterized protein YtfP